MSGFRREYLDIHNSSVEIRVESDLDAIKQAETDRVLFYLNNYEWYEKNNYSHILRFPDGIDPSHIYDEAAVATIVNQEVDANSEYYLAFAFRHEESINRLKQKGVDEIAYQLYGMPFSLQFKLNPTAYGTIASPANVAEKKPAFFRLSNFSQSNGNLFQNGIDRTISERLIHEAYAHSVTQNLRSNTAISDFSNECTAVAHKERLMDLLGRTILVRAGLFERDEVVMQKLTMMKNGDEAVEMVDNLYYGKEIDESEQNIAFDGNIQGLINALITRLKAR